MFRADNDARAGRVDQRGFRGGQRRYHRQYRWPCSRGALIGGPVGLLAGALIGDHLMGQEKRQQDQAAENERELERLRSENQRLSNVSRGDPAGSAVAELCIPPDSPTPV